MEQWEKEYIESITKSKQGKSVDCSYEEGYDSSKWIEITRTDGTKYYMPKESAFHKQQSGKQKQSFKSFAPKVRQLLKVAIRILLAFILLRGILLSGRESPIHSSEWAKSSRHISLQGVIQGKLLGGTYIDGYGFADMMCFFKEMQSERYSFLDDIARNINSLSEVDVEQWSQVLDEREKQILRLKYAESYQQYVNAEKEVFLKQKELLTLVKHHAEIHIVLELYNQLATADLSLRSKLIEALEKNGIEYSVNQNELVYWYKSY